MTDKLFAYDRQANNDWINKLIDLEDLCPAKAAGLMSHILNAQQIWISRMTDHESDLGAWDYCKPEHWMDVLDQNHRGFEAVLSERSLHETFFYYNSNDDEFSDHMGNAMMHVLLHGQYHRGQIAALVQEKTGETIPTDFIFYNR